MAAKELEERHRRLLKFLIAERKKHKLLQFQLANRLGKSATWVARLEAGERRITIFDFVDLAKAIGFDPAKCLRRFAQMEPDKKNRAGR